MAIVFVLVLPNSRKFVFVSLRMFRDVATVLGLGCKIEVVVRLVVGLRLVL